MSQPTVTLENCATEPIHVPGSTQPHGALFAVRGDDFVVVHASDNAGTFVCAPVAEIIGQPLAAFFSPASIDALRAAAGTQDLRSGNPRRLSSPSGDSFDAVVHRSADLMVVEIERSAPDAQVHLSGFDPRLREVVMSLQSASSVGVLFALAATEIRRLTGFDRVMVYRFDPEWNGEVVAEDRREDLEPFLGQHYPASDIPAQARRLYTVNWLRFVCDVHATPSALVPVVDPATNLPLDMSFATLRSVSPIHIQYLKNMGVSASMSVSLIVDGKLAGLIACHHYSGPRQVPITVRDTCEFVAHALSWQLRLLETAHVARETARVAETQAEIGKLLAITPDLLDALATPEMMRLTASDGLAVVLHKSVRCLGTTPSTAAVLALRDWLQKSGLDTFETDRLAIDAPTAPGWSEIAGLVAVAISRDVGEYILWFRAEHRRTIKWAGNPTEKGAPVTLADGVPRLTPRGSFALWQEVVKDRSLRWEPWHVDAAHKLRQLLLGGVRRNAVEMRQLNDRLIATDRAKDEFLATVSHELRTPLNAITGWASLLRGEESSPRVERGLEIIARNAEAQAELIEDLLDMSRIESGKVRLDVTHVDVVRLVEAVLDELHVSIEAKGLRLKRIIDPAAGAALGDPVRLRQIISNLIGNAVKFTEKGGSITVSLRRKSSDIELLVSDSGAGIDPAFLPFVFDAFRQQDASAHRRTRGLGLGLAIVRKLVELHGGVVSAQSEGVGRGATFSVRLPFAPLREDEDVASTDPRPIKRELSGLRVLIVEDEPDARELLHMLLHDHGATVESFDHAVPALVRLTETKFDVIVSDVGLPVMDGLAFMRTLRARPVEQGSRTPALALTAYTRAVDRTSALQAGFQAHVPKPVDPQELLIVIASVVGRLDSQR